LIELLLKLISKKQIEAINFNYIKMPNIIANELTIEGKNVDIQQFIDDHYKYHDFYKDMRWNIPNIGGIECNIYDDACRLSFNTAWDTPREWLGKVQRKYSSLKFSMYWRDTDDEPCSGIVDMDGQDFNIMNENDFKLACKLLKEHKQRASMSSIPILPVISTTPTGFSTTSSESAIPILPVISTTSLKFTTIPSELDMPVVSCIPVAPTLPMMSTTPLKFPKMERNDHIDIIQLSEGVYYTVEHNLLIRKVGDDSQYICTGIYDLKSGEITALTPEKIEVCNRYSLKYVKQ
jgi:hypothetical protein